MKAQRQKKTWDCGKELGFIQLWQQHPCLFNISSSSYHDRKRKDAAWNAIAAYLHIPVEEVTTRASSLRTQYGKLLRLKSIGESSPNLTQRQKWILKHLAFLRPHLKKPHGSLQDSGPQITAVSAWDDSQSEQAASFSSTSSAPASPKPVSCSSSHHKETRKTKTPIKVKRESSPKEEELNLDQEKIKLLKLVAANSSNGKNDDDDDIFGKQVACEMRLIRDPMDKLLARRAITKVLYDAQDRSMTHSVAFSQSASHQMYDFLPFKEDSGELGSEVDG